MDYFERSQEIKKEIEENPQLMDKLRKAFGTNMKPFADSSHTNIYRIGQLNSGTYVALRVDFSLTDFRKNISSLINERYCLNAEILSKEGKRVPKFCVGAIFGKDPDGLVGIVTEDLSDGGRSKVIEIGSRWGGVRCLIVKPNGEKEIAYVDIDYEFNDLGVTPNNLKYFKEGNFIQL